MATKNYYDSFVKEGRNVSFTDDQIDFLWDWIHEVARNPEAYTHEDNYVPSPTSISND